ncbi:hypothetical protein QF035_005318 [Streptomyces umbrinus]|uniref:Peptidase inhibitor family I36 n=1 Tax=Streptomyces umbrinus TaxID=67370 RepID=A0ABU0SW06_9ACTN|nr:hypothetical protein [Streptomyces umbrinus]MDQ1027736.1 hypothetical protein [Streptomyces umbrinus]
MIDSVIIGGGRMKFFKRAAAVGVAAVSLSLVAVPQAGATTYTGADCSGAYPCLVFYYNSNFKGSAANFVGYGKIDNLAGYNFATSGSGKGLSVKNNAASAFFIAKTADETAAIYYNSNQGGSCDELWAQGSKQAQANQLRNTYNNNASLKIFDGSQSSGICYQF